MTTIQINEEQSRVQEFLDLAVKKFNFNITVLDTAKSKNKKWGEFAKKMSGLTNPQITQHIKETKEDMRDGFELRKLSAE